MRRLLIAGLLAGCYGPRLQAGSPCSVMQPCPSPLSCDPVSLMCEPSGATGSNTGLDAHGSSSSDAPSAPANDLPSNPTPITGTMTITEDITWAHDDAQGNGSKNCGGSGGRDVFFSVTNASFGETWYFDTFGSTYDTIIRTFSGACVGGVQPQGTTCQNNACGVVQSQLAVDLAQGENCIVVDENPAGSGSSGPPSPATLVLNVEKTGRGNGIPLIGIGFGSVSITSNTCNNATAFWTGSCGGVGDEDAYYFTVCPSTTKTLNATTCGSGTSATYDTVLYVRQTSTDELGCNATDTACTLASGASTLTPVPVTGPHVFWLVVDSLGSGSGSCGAYELDTSLQ